MNRNCHSASAPTLTVRNETAKEKWSASVQKIGIARSFAHFSENKNSNGHLSSFTPKPKVQPEADNLEGLSWRRMLASRAKLKASSTTSEILAAFALITMVELQINSPTEVPEWLFVLFALNTTIVVSFNVLSITISSYVLPGLDAAAKMGDHNSELFATSPHDRMKKCIEIAWVLSNILGLLMFFVQLAILLWVKFWDFSFNAAFSATVLIVPFVLIIFGSGLYFYHVLAVIKSKKLLKEVSELEDMKMQLDSVV